MTARNPTRLQGPPEVPKTSFGNPVGFGPAGRQGQDSSLLIQIPPGFSADRVNAKDPSRLDPVRLLPEAHNVVDLWFTRLFGNKAGKTLALSRGAHAGRDAQVRRRD